MTPSNPVKHQTLPATGDPNGTDIQMQNATAASMGIRRTSQKLTNGHADDSNSPVSRTGTPNMYGAHLPIYHGVEDPQLQAQSLQGFAASATAEGRAPSPLNGERLDAPQTQEQLLAANSSLKTRVSELEVINDFIRGRLEQLETYGAGPREGEVSQTETQLRTQLEATTKAEAELRAQLEDSHRRENNLKRRLDELEVELKEAKDALEAHESGREKKKPRVADVAEESEETSTPQSAA